jgi:hypothetical protein
VVSTNIYYFLDCLGTLGSIVAGAKSPREPGLMGQEKRTNFRKAQQARRESWHIRPTSVRAHMPCTNPDGADSKYTNSEAVCDHTCHPRSCFGLEPMADRNTLKDTERCWLQVKWGQKGAQLLARFDLSDQVPVKTIHGISYCRWSKRGIAAHQ